MTKLTKSSWNKKYPAVWYAKIAGVNAALKQLDYLGFDSRCHYIWNSIGL